MKHTRALKLEEYDLIRNIAFNACQLNTELKHDECYTITLLYFLRQFGGLKSKQVPIEFAKSVNLLYKSPKSSYIHYFNDIQYSDDVYAKTIKRAEIEMLGDDPRCPW